MRQGGGSRIHYDRQGSGSRICCDMQGFGSRIRTPGRASRAAGPQVHVCMQVPRGRCLRGLLLHLLVLADSGGGRWRAGRCSGGLKIQIQIECQISGWGYDGVRGCCGCSRGRGRGWGCQGLGLGRCRWPLGCLAACGQLPRRWPGGLQGLGQPGGSRGGSDRRGLKGPGLPRPFPGGRWSRSTRHARGYV